MRWAELESQQPRLAAFAREKLAGPGVVLVGTTRRDGTARISPVEPMFWEGDLWLSMGPGSRKAGDLGRDPRILVHSVVTKRDGSDGEVKVRGRAIPVEAPDVLAGFARAVTETLGWTPDIGQSHVFRIDVEEVTVVRWIDATNDQFVTRWPAMVDELRPGTSAQARGPAVPSPDPLLT
jgi:Pyridoxamine 5'-phosphate oxidase